MPLAALVIALAHAAALPQAAPTEIREAAQEVRTSIAWFEGSFDEALAAAKASGRLVFVDFWSLASPWTQKLHARTFTDAAVGKAMEAFVCVSVDAASESGRALAKAHGVSAIPTLLFLESDGSPRDVLLGYVAPAPFAEQAKRIASGVGTITGLRARLETEPGDLDARYDLAKKLAQVGDEAGAREQIDAIHARDPEGEARASRKLALDAAARDVQQAIEKSDARFRELMQGESDPGLLYTGWSWIYRIDAHLATRGGDESAALEKSAREAARKAWPGCPLAERALFGNEIAWHFYEHRAELDADEKAFALSVSTEAADRAPEDANALDTYACCLAMNGKRDEAIAVVKRCIALEPDNPEHAQRLAELGGR